MDLQSIIKTNIDFCNKNHVIINAKRYDKQSRYILFSCYNKNEFVRIDKAAYTAFVRYRKADNYGVFNKCTITDDGCVLVELTEQMLAASGLCCADLIIAKGRSLTFDPNDGTIIGQTKPNILSTMTFYVDVSETPVENSEIESSYDFSGFNQALESVKDDISDVIKKAKSWAVGGTGTRVGEDLDNAKYYYEQCMANIAGASVIGVKGDKESNYRQGNVNITAANVGAIPSADIATVNEIKTYLDIS